VDRTSRPFQLALDVLAGADKNCRTDMKAHPGRRARAANFLSA
jgi:hypothetical protein